MHEESEDEIKNIAIEVSPLDQALSIVKEGVLALEADIINGRLQLKVDKTAVPKIVKALALQDCEIYSVENVTVSLEEKFLQITGEGGQIA